MTLRFFSRAAAVTIATAAMPLHMAQAALPVGSNAPDFTVEAALAGQPFEFSLSEALQKGPVVLYFYPKAFTKGCTIEAHTFAEAIDDYHQLNATVLGISNDNIDTLKEFSLGPCGSKFAVGADNSGAIIRDYDALLGTESNRANRISYVISPQGKVVYTYSSMEPEGHIHNTLDALKSLNGK